ncbi:hypothetical protein OAB57_00370, partial [Bacteriovoracaceae bacterium]|nr:hypothetical protein [Bacteriovoracaceae bacterium]
MLKLFTIIAITCHFCAIDKSHGQVNELQEDKIKFIETIWNSFQTEKKVQILNDYPDCRNNIIRTNQNYFTSLNGPSENEGNSFSLDTVTFLGLCDLLSENEISRNGTFLSIKKKLVDLF